MAEEKPAIFRLLEDNDISDLVECATERGISPRRVQIAYTTRRVHALRIRSSSVRGTQTKKGEGTSKNRAREGEGVARVRCVSAVISGGFPNNAGAKSNGESHHTIVETGQRKTNERNKRGRACVPKDRILEKETKYSLKAPEYRRCYQGGQDTKTRTTIGRL
ncbi:hypothetical protein KM043_009193 [Ampulex compressa]|nr:hypothetical protein KM043_009193 [Ampulex compressa]